jgi:hypothetical protein
MIDTYIIGFNPHCGLGNYNAIGEGMISDHYGIQFGIYYGTPDLKTRMAIKGGFKYYVNGGDIG